MYSNFARAASNSSVTRLARFARSPALRPHTLLVQHIYHSHSALNQPQYRGVVRILDVVQRDALRSVLGNHRGENVEGKFLLNFLVRVVDAQLLKPIDLKGFEAKYVKKANPSKLRSSDVARVRIDFANEPVENASVELLRKRISVTARIDHAERDFEALSFGCEGTEGEGLAQLFLVQAKNFSQVLQLTITHHNAGVRVLVVLCKGDVSKLRRANKVRKRIE